MDWPRGDLANIQGAIENPSTFGSPIEEVLYKTVEGANHERMLGDVSLRTPFIKAAKKLEAKGAQAIIANCGFSSLFQLEVAESLSIPICLSSLSLVPLVYNLFRGDSLVGVITWDARYLGEKHFKGAGWSSENIPIAKIGVEDTAWHRVEWEKEGGLGEKEHLELRKSLSEVSVQLCETHTNISSLVMECGTFPLYSKSVRAATSKPVFDILTATQMVCQGIIQQPHEQ